MKRKPNNSNYKSPSHNRKFHLFNRELGFTDLFFTFLGCFAGIGFLSLLSQNYGLALLAPSFGASSVLLFGTPQVPMAQPRNVIFGHTLSALIGVLSAQFFGTGWLGITLGVTLAVLAMLITDTTHPPGGATALVAAMNGVGFDFIFMPIFVGAIILVGIAVLTNHFSSKRSYPVNK